MRKSLWKPRALCLRRELLPHGLRDGTHGPHGEPRLEVQPSFAPSTPALPPPACPTPGNTGCRGLVFYTSDFQPFSSHGTQKPITKLLLHAETYIGLQLAKLQYSQKTPPNKSPGPEGFTGELHQTFTEERTPLLKLSQNIREERLLSSTYEASIILVPNQLKTLQRKETIGQHP